MINSTLEPSIQTVINGARKFLSQTKIPAGPFDPGGAWQQTLGVWMHLGKRYMGLLHLEKRQPREGAFELAVDWKLRQQTKDFQQVVATIQCSPGALATPSAWRIRSTTLRPSGEVIPDLTIDDRAQVKNGVIELADGRRRFAQNPLGDWTCNWSLLEAVQRLDGQVAKPLSFSVLDFLETRKDQQTLSVMDAQEVTLPDRTAAWHSLQQIGYGFLPWEYWLDDQHRLVAARTTHYCLFAMDKEVEL